MISKKMADRINEQINREMFSAYLYMAMSARMTETGYRGVGKWLMIQYHEEMFHAMKFYGYLQDQGFGRGTEGDRHAELQGDRDQGTLPTCARA